jgi:hypothetical protein
LSQFLPAIGAFFAKSMMQGLGASFVTLRVGYLTKKYLFAGGKTSIQKDKTAARAEARRALPQVVVASLTDLPRGIARRIEKLIKKGSPDFVSVED